ncbi:hypothetical protein BKA56DRAFT_677137 [Ilyonectria sp. MPI-CAGE-AT-0026]|nr:hypothetical protein BKA56DRAFT_677137 [Ilyonectria sp. MPI-CAGE-AT-0026]
MATEWDISRRVDDAASDSFERYPDFRISRPEPISLPSTAQAETSSGSANSSVNELPDFIPAAPQLSSRSAQRELFSGITTCSDVNDAARYCMRAFSSLISAPKEQQATDNETIKFSKANRIVFMNQFSRFKIWAAKVEALSAGFSSVNYRLDGDSVIGDVLLKLLKRLSEKLESVPTGDNSPSVQSVPGEDDADTISSDSSSESDDESSRGEEKERNTPPQPLWIRIIEETITNLYKITTLAERSNIHTEDQSMAKWLERNSTEVDDELSDLRLHIQRLLEKKFARLRFSPFLKDRLILAVLNRRKRLLYHGSRHQKCQHGVKDAFDSMVLASTSPLETQRGIHTRSVLEHPPSLASNGVTEFACPYCIRPLGEEMFSADKTNWNRHVLLDLQPYVCLFRDCDSPLSQYCTKDEWVNHMAWTHAKIWTCQIRGHEMLQFLSAGALKAHLLHDHTGPFSANQLRFMAEKGAKPAPNVFAYLAADSEFKSISECPFCLFPASDAPCMAPPYEETYSRIRDHISSHLESIALVSLPRTRDSDKSVSEARQEQDSEFQSADISASSRPFRSEQGEEREEQLKLPSFPPQPLRKQYSPHVGSYTHTRARSNSSNYTAPSKPQHSRFPSYDPQHSPTQRSPLSAGPILRGLAMAPPAPYRPYLPYQSLPTMGEFVVSNTRQPGVPIARIPGVVIPTAQEERPYKCDQCVLSFVRNHDLKRHKRIHWGTKAFPCSFCGKGFSRKDALKRHRLVRGCEKKSSQADISHDGEADRDVDVVEIEDEDEESASHMQKD